MIVLILVAVLWIAVLIPSVLSKLSERRSGGSIDHFHQRLDLLERTGPKLVAPAFRLTKTESPSGTPTPLLRVAPHPQIRPNLILVPPIDDATPLSEPLDADWPVPDDVVRILPSSTEGAESPVPPMSMAEERMLVAQDRRQLARRRRRDVFGCLCALTALSGLLGLVRPLRGAWIVSAVVLALLLVFVGLAMYGQRVEAERRHLQHLRRAERARFTKDDLGSGAVKYLSADEVARYQETENTQLAAEA